jgi:hypothetical protein
MIIRAAETIFIYSRECIFFSTSITRNAMCKKTFFIVLFLQVMAPVAGAQSFYDINTIQTIAITFQQSNWDYMLDTAKAGSDGYIMGSVTINGTAYDSVGVKYKGNSTYNANQVKNPFHIELDTYKEQDYMGYTDVKLSNVAKDPSFVREVLSYELLRQYMDAPQSNYAHVYVNGVLLGLYVNCESIGKKFVYTHFYSKTNSFFKCNPIDGAVPGTTTLPNLVYQGADSASYMKAYEIKSDYGWKDLITLCNTLKNDIGNIESVLDIDRALWMIAFDNVLVNIDSYIGVFAQNYYLYKDNTGRFNCVLWDFNESFGTFNSTGTIMLQNTAAKIQMTHLLHSGDANWPLVQKLLSVPMYKRMYLAHMQTILSENFSNTSYVTKAQAYLPVINAAVQADPNKFFTYAQYQSNLTTDVSAGMTSAPGITNLMNNRYAYLSGLTDFTATRPVISGVMPGDTLPTVNNNIFITAKITNANSNSVFLGYRYTIGDKFTRMLMYDDGVHGDGAAGDGLYGCSVSVKTALIQYYIYAENSSAGIFSPARAEYEFYTVNCKTAGNANDAVMNEIYARGTTADPDWVELYNPTSASINLSGYKIYDAGGQSGSKTKKEIPSGTILQSRGFYVIITEDGSASGFGLSSSGEQLWLEKNNGKLIDSVNFTGHAAAQSYGRNPDGGSWQLLNTITRGTSNGTASRIRNDLAVVKDFVLHQNYPNPFNPATEISFSIPAASLVSLKIFDALGREVSVLLESELHAGNYVRQWNAEGKASGVYFYRLQAGRFTDTKKLVLAR